MKSFIRLSFILVLILLYCTAPTLADDVAPVPVELAFNFDEIVPGRLGMVMVTGWDVASATGMFDGRPVYFHRDGESLVALIAASLEIEREGQYLDASITLYSGEVVNYHLPVKIAWAGYGKQTINIPSNLGYLLEPAINDTETQLLLRVYSQNSPQRFWDGQLELPVDGTTTSPFGVYRSYNDGTLTARHTGQDLRAPVGTPVHASAPGRVVLAESLDVRGNTVIIDHGWGVLTGYSHFSEILVEPGQMVQAGEIIGMSGNTGRSTGPHLHWELAVGGTWVDPLVWVMPEMP